MSKQPKRNGYDGLPEKYGITRAEFDAIEHAAKMDGFGWKVITGRVIRKATCEGLVARGFMADAGHAVLVDGDGFTVEPERERQAYELTDTGRNIWRRIDAARGGRVADEYGVEVWLMPDGSVEHWDGKASAEGWGAFHRSALAGVNLERYGAWTREHFGDT